jgi:hypothetical protein
MLSSLSGLEVDHQHERGRLDNRQIGRAELGHYQGGPIAGLRVAVSLGTSDSLIGQRKMMSLSDLATGLIAVFVLLNLTTVG